MRGTGSAWGGSTSGSGTISGCEEDCILRILCDPDKVSVWVLRLHHLEFMLPSWIRT